MGANGSVAMVHSADEAAHALEMVLVQGDLSKLTTEQRVQYYNRTCESLGLNPMSRPFEYITLNGKLTLYARKDCTDQLRKLYHVSIRIVSRERIDDVYVVTARAILPDGREDESTGVVAIGNAKGDTLANALMKAETKSKRRVTLSVCGLGILDESEIETVPGARPERRKLEAAPPTEQTEAPEELTLEQQRDKWIELLNACATKEDLAKVNAAIKERGYSKEFKKALMPAYDAATQRVTEEVIS